jgi:hypothetical protein
VEPIDVNYSEHAPHSFAGTTAAIWVMDRECDADRRQHETLKIVTIPFEYAMEGVIFMSCDHTRTTTRDRYNAQCTFVDGNLSRTAPAGDNIANSLKGNEVFKELVSTLLPFLELVMLGLPSSI